MHELNGMKSTAVIVVLFILLFAALPYSKSNTVYKNGCESCHSDFVPFYAELRKNGSAADICVKNVGEHHVRNLKCLLRTKESEPFEKKIADDITRFESKKYEFDVDEGAYSVSVKSSGDEGILGRNDINLVLKSPHGKIWKSENRGMEEEINLYLSDIEEGGYGTYEIDVEYAGGIGRINYIIEVLVKYGDILGIKDGEDLSPGESYTFTWTDVPEKAEFIVSADVYYDHRDPTITDEEHYSQVLSAGEVSFPSPIPSSTGTSYIARITGFASLFLILLLLTSSVHPSLRRKFARYHCILGITVVILCATHTYLLLFSGRGLLLGVGALSLTLAAIISGMKKFRMIKKWRKLHRLLAVLAVILILLHAIIDGATITI